MNYFLSFYPGIGLLVFLWNVGVRKIPLILRGLAHAHVTLSVS